jgi:hypothetical protein
VHRIPKVLVTFRVHTVAKPAPRRKSGRTVFKELGNAESLEVRV